MFQTSIFLTAFYKTYGNNLESQNYTETLQWKHLQVAAGLYRSFRNTAVILETHLVMMEEDLKHIH